MSETENETSGPDATEAAAEYAAEHDVDLAGITGTGADGRITKADVEEHVAQIDTGVGVEAGASAEVHVKLAPNPHNGHAPKVWTGPQR